MHARASLWPLDPDVAYLNHGSFGACPCAILEHQATLRSELEREPVHFFLRRSEALLDDSRSKLAAFVGASAEDIGFVSNATSGVNTVLRSLPFREGDEIMVTNHAYNACRNALDFVASRTRATAVVVSIPAPVAGPEAVLQAVLSKVTPRTRVALVDHVTSPTGMIFPIDEIVRALAGRGVDTLVDGAHAPGMVPLAIDRIGAAYYTGNCHKWLCAPKGAGFLHVRRDRQSEIRPLTISHGANVARPGRSFFQTEFDWTGTDDPTAFHCVGECVRYLGTLLPGGWPELMAANRTLALEGRSILIDRVGLQPLAPPEMIGSLVSFFLPESLTWPPAPGIQANALQVLLYDRFRIEIPIVAWPSLSRQVIRISAQLYNDRADYERLADALETCKSLTPPGKVLSSSTGKS